MQSPCTEVRIPLPTLALTVLALIAHTVAQPRARASGRSLDPGWRAGALHRTPPPTARKLIERINLSGNHTVRDRVIRRELLFSVGDSINILHLATSRSRVLGLGYFTQATFAVTPGSAADRIVINLHVTERPSGVFFVYVGRSWPPRAPAVTSQRGSQARAVRTNRGAP